MVLDQDAKKTLERAEDGAVEHQWMMLLAVSADIGRIEPLGHLRVELQGSTLPGSANGVLQMKFKLGPVECALSRQHFINKAGLLERRFEVRLGPVPLLVAADPLVRPGSEFHLVIGEAKVAIDLVEQGAKGFGLFNQLFVRAEDMGVVLRELTDAHDAVERAVRLVAVAAPKFSETERQFPVGGDALPEYLDMRRAVHRLERQQVRR